MFEPPRYMTVAQAAEQLLQAIARSQRDGSPHKREHGLLVDHVHCGNMQGFVGYLHNTFPTGRPDGSVSLCGRGTSGYPDHDCRLRLSGGSVSVGPRRPASLVGRAGRDAPSGGQNAAAGGQCRDKDRDAIVLGALSDRNVIVLGT